MLLVAVILLGLGSRKFGAQLPDLIAGHAGDALWTVAVYLCLAIAFPHWPAWKLGVCSLGLSVMVELSQLIRVPWLDALRTTLPGKLLLGAGFLWIDLIRYAAGAGLATAVDWRLGRKGQVLPHPGFNIS